MNNLLTTSLHWPAYSRKRLLLAFGAVSLFAGGYSAWSFASSNPLLRLPMDTHPVEVSALTGGHVVQSPPGAFRLPPSLRYAVLGNTTVSNHGSLQQSLTLRLQSGPKQHPLRGAMILEATQSSATPSNDPLTAAAGQQPEMLRDAIESPGFNPVRLLIRKAMVMPFGSDLKIQRVTTPRLSGYRLTGSAGESGRSTDPGQIVANYILPGSGWSYMLILRGDRQLCPLDTFAKVVGSFKPAL